MSIACAGACPGRLPSDVVDDVDEVAADAGTTTDAGAGATDAGPRDGGADNAADAGVIDAGVVELVDAGRSLPVFQNSWGGYGTDEGEFIEPSSVELDVDGTVIVAGHEDRVQRFTRDGALIDIFGVAGTAGGE